MTRTTMDLPTLMIADARMLMMLQPSGPQTFKGLVVSLLQQRLDLDRAALERLRSLQRTAAKRR